MLPDIRLLADPAGPGAHAGYDVLAAAPCHLIRPNGRIFCRIGEKQRIPVGVGVRHTGWKR